MIRNERALSAAQKRVLNLFFDNEWKCAFSLGASLTTLNALTHNGYLQRRAEVGHMFSPRTNILFRVTEKGKSHD